MGNKRKKATAGDFLRHLEVYNLTKSLIQSFAPGCDPSKYIKSPSELAAQAEPSCSYNPYRYLAWYNKYTPLPGKVGCEKGEIIFAPEVMDTRKGVIRRGRLKARSECVPANCVGRIPYFMSLEPYTPREVSLLSKYVKALVKAFKNIE